MTMSYEDRDTYGMYKSYDNEGPGPRLMGASTLMGEDVYNTKDEDLGDIKEIMLDMNTGRVAYAVLSFGGFLGIADKLFAVPWNALKLDTQNKRFILNVDKDRLESAPGFDKDHWPDMADPTWQNTINSYYGTTSYTDSSQNQSSQNQSQTRSSKDYTTPAHLNNERIIPVAPVGTDHVSDKLDDFSHK